MNNLLANLGFLLQLSGYLIFFVAIVAIYLNEIKEAVSFFITASIFFFFGFPLNALSERKEINFKESLILFFLTFLFLGIIGSIPYIYLNLFKSENVVENLINSLFESVSGFTTTGFTFIKSEELSKSMIIYRAFSQFIGGIGIVYLLLTFLYSPKHKVLYTFSKFLFSEITQKIKKNVAEILIFYTFFTMVLSFIMYYFNQDVIKSFSLIMSSISTGGFPHYDLKSLRIEEKILIVISMLVGSTSIFILSKLKKEIPIFILMILICFLILNLNGIENFDSLFHAVSLVSTTGYYYIDFNLLPQYSLLIFSIIMLIGGMSISTAGGIKIIRVINSIKVIYKTIKNFILEIETEIKEEFISIIYVILFLSLWIFVSLLFLFYYQDSSNKSFFESASFLSTSGFSVGLVKEDIKIELKIVLIFIMILARIEILPLFAIFVNKKFDE